MLVNFVKMQALGNDFVVIDMLTQNPKIQSPHIKQMADRHFGIGCDQVILIEPPIQRDSEFYYRIFNADGEEVEQCGNGARAAAKFFFDSGYVNNKHFKADCFAGPVEFQIEEDETISINLGFPIFTPSKIPFLENTEARTYPYQFHNQAFQISVLSLGNPHAVVQVTNLENIPVTEWGALLSKDPKFPNGSNVEFIEIINRDHIKMRVFERGVGETLACGTGAAAAVIAGKRGDLLNSIVRVELPAGNLEVQWDSPKHAVFLRGVVHAVFIGRFRL